MCDELALFIERCEPLIRRGRFEELEAELHTQQSHTFHCLPCRQQSAFYRAVCLGMAQPRDYVSSQALLAALIESDPVGQALRARARNFSGMLARFQDQYSQALSLYQQAFEACATIGDLNGQARALLNQAVILNNHLYKPQQALRLLDQAEELLKRAGNKRDVVRILNERGLCLMRLEHWAEAHQALQSSLALCVEQENAYFEAICAVNLGSWERLQGHWAQAQAYYAPLPAFFEELGNPLLQSEVLFYLSQTAQAQDKLEQAKRYLLQVLRLADENKNRHFIALAYLGQARLTAQRGADKQVLELYWQTAHAVEQIRSAQGVQDVRLDFQAQWNAMYREAAAYALQLGQLQSALLFSEHARARLLLDTLGVPPDVTRPDAPPDLLSELEQLGTALHQSYVQQIAGSLDQAGQARLEAQETRIAAVRARLQRYDQKTLPYQSPPQLPQIQQALSENAVILSYFATEDDLIVFGIDQNQVRQCKLPVSLAQIEARLTPQGQVRGIVPDERTGRLSPHLGILYMLHRGLLEPITAWLSDYTNIYLAPDAALRHVPFHLLKPGPGQPSPLTEGQRRLMYLPSASVLTRLPALRVTDELLALGHNGPDLMLIEAHAGRLGERANCQALCGSAARREAVMQKMNRYSQIYFAGHNIFRTPAPADCGLLLAENRLLTLLDIQQLRLNGSRVILGACQSSLVAEHGGDWLGLTSAFLQAGAAQIMGTLWRVSEVTTCILMDCFWTALLKDASDPALALQRAQAKIRSLTLDDMRQLLSGYELQAQDYIEEQLLALQNARPDETYPLDHPYYWAPFILIGI